MKKRTNITIFFALSLFSHFVFADEDVSWGCGVSRMIMPSKSLFSSSAGFTTDVALLPTNLIATADGTSGCVEHKLVYRYRKPYLFLKENMQKIKLDIAKGDGEYFQAYAFSLGCHKKSRDKFVEELRNRIEIFNFERKPINVFIESLIVIDNNDTLRKECGNG